MNTSFAKNQIRGNCILTILVLAFAWGGSIHGQTFTVRTNLLSDTSFRSGVPMGVVDMNGDGLDDIVRLDLSLIHI